MKQRSLLLILVLFGFLIWLPSSNVIELIINNDEVVLGRYSRGHFGALLLLTLIAWIAAGILYATRKKSVGESIFALVMVFLSTGVSAFLLVIASGYINKPRYIEQKVSGVDAETGIVLSGIIRHRPPNERFDLMQEDKPEQLRSYPNAPQGYPAFPVVLTTDKNGFRNASVQERYDMLAVGDSFVAGSHVSDNQAWVDLLRHATQQSIYNLGVSGSSPLVYLNNFVALGRQFHPKIVLVMLYEGNDFRDAPPLPKASGHNSQKQSENDAVSIAALAKASPVTKGLARLTGEVLAKIGSQSPVPEYASTVGFMPLMPNSPAGTHAYSFEPKRLRYLVDMDETEFAASSDWNNVRDVLDQFVALSKKDNFRLIFVYAPSAPHVVLPLAEKNIPAQQLLNFINMKRKTPLNVEPETYKKQVFARLDVNENVWMQWCERNHVECVSTTSALRAAVAAGKQVYYTYDQHWTPEGNVVTAAVLDAYLKKSH